ncbi:hypothetical protein [Phyllobacterium phragmitis]|nr:hypothetical protein [Phyllobacterium phragmitis]
MLQSVGVHIPGTAARRKTLDELKAIEIEAGVLASIRGFIA